jgi:signal transduction histidine kinase
MHGYCSMIVEEEIERLSPEAAEYLHRVMQAAARMDALIRDSLQYGRIVAQRSPLACVEPAAILRGILHTYPNLQSPNLQLEILEPLPVVMAHEAGLAQCFSNLLANAVKFVNPGTIPHVRIWAENRPSPPLDEITAKPLSLHPRHPVVRFWFEDNGIGIPKQYHDRVFGMFQQLDKAYEGTGIGLALVRKTAERMNGRAGIESEPGKGSRFWLEFEKAPVPSATTPAINQL